MHIKTLIQLIRESKSARFSTLLEKISHFKTLLSLYIASKFSQKSERILSCKIVGFLIHAYDYYHLIFLYKEIFVGHAYHFTSLTFTPTIIDCGANIGMSILYFKKLYPDSEIISFEPNPHAYLLLEKNINDNRLTNVKIYQKALSDRNGITRLTIPQQKGALDASIISNHTDGEIYDIETMKLSEIINNKKIDLLKMDIEGAEEAVMKDLMISGTIQNISCIILEFHESSNKLTIEEFYNKYFKANGFDLTIQENQATKETTGDKLLFLSR